MAIATSMFACSALLGDFTVGGASSGGLPDGAGDGTLPPNPEGGGDGSDAAPRPPLLKCGFDGAAVNLVTDPAITNRINVHAFGRKRRVMITRKSSPKVDFVTIDENLAPASQVTKSVDALSQAPGLASYDGGFVVLGLSSPQTLSPRIVATRFDDNAVNAETPTIISPVPSGLPIAPTDFSIAVAPVDGIDDFFVVYSHANALQSNTWSMYAGRAHIGSTAAPGNGSFTLVSGALGARPSLESNLLLIDKPDRRAILFMSPDGANGSASVVQLDLASGALVGTPQKIPPIHGASTFLPLAAQTTFGMEGDRAALAFLEYDLNSATQPLFGYAGTFPPAGLDNFKPSMLPPGVSFPGTSDVAVDKVTAFWTHYPAGSHVVEAARLTDTGEGVNFLWFDGFGNLRGRATGAEALKTGNLVQGAAGTLVKEPSVLIGNAAVAWVATDGSLLLANVGCSK